jgi:hypothetical protein
MHLSPGGQQFRGDDGSADPAVAEALSRFGNGEGSEHAALTALAASRLLVPVVAVLAEAGEVGEAGEAGGDGEAGESGEGGGGGAVGRGSGGGGEKSRGGGEKSSEMALPTLIGQDGRPAIIAFTCVASLARWRADARPMPAEADRVWRAAVAERAAVVVDVAGPVPLVIEGARLDALAAGQQPPQPDEDPDVHAAIESVLAAEPMAVGARLGPPVAAGTKMDLHVQLLLAPGGEPAVQRTAVQRTAEQISAVLARRFRRGVEFSAAIVGPS